MGILNKRAKNSDNVEKDDAVSKKPAPKKAKAKKASSEVSIAPEMAQKTEMPLHVVPGAEIARKVLKHPLITEKSATDELEGRYTFVVAKDATKVQIKQAIKQLYGVVPSRVHTMHYDGKKVRFGAKQGRRNDWKKAIVFMPKGTTIAVHEGV